MEHPTKMDDLGVSLILGNHQMENINNPPMVSDENGNATGEFIYC